MKIGDFLMKVMSEIDIKKVHKAIDALDKLNAKYKKPYGQNTFGIVINTYQNLKLKELQTSP